MSSAILINPFEKSITTVEIDLVDDYAICRLLQCETLDVERFGDQGDVCIFDDVGLLKNTDEQEYFIFRICTETPPGEIILPGRVLIAGADPNQGFVPPDCTADYIDENGFVVWIDHTLGASYALQFWPVPSTMDTKLS